MGTESSRCPSCHAAVASEDKFCGSCGAVLGGAGPKPPAKATMLGLSPAGLQTPSGAPQPASGNGGGHGRKATMLGISPSAPPASAPADKPSVDPALQKTMLGMQSPFAPAGPAPSPQSADAPASELGLQKTVFGVSSTGAGAAEAPSGGEPTGHGAKKTMLGMVSPLAGQNAPAADSAASPSSGGQAQPPTAEKPHAGAAASKGRTMLGMMSPLAGGGVGAEANVAAPKAAPDPQTHRTMLGMSQPAGAGQAPAPASGPASRDELPSFSQPSQVRDEPDTGELALSAGLGGRTSTSSGRRGLWGAVAVVALLLAAVALAFVFLSGGPEVEVAVVASEQGDALRVRVPEAPPGTKVRFGGVEAPVEAGAAVFPLAADALRVGHNQVSLDILEPDGDISTSDVELRVDYRVRMELSSLAADQPAVAVVVDAVQGTQVSIDGTPREISSGSVRVPFEVGDTKGPRYDLVVPYSVQPPGGRPVEGKLELHLPVASMQLDRPGDEVFTDANHVEIGGAVEPGAEVRVDGKPVEVSDGRFLYRQPLGKPGEYTFSVVARAEGKAPRAQTVKVTRVDDMAVAAAAFEYDEDLSYARIAQNPAIYRGQRVRFDGRVYNVEVQGGRSVLQMLVRDCPRQHKCQLWVDYAQATDATVGSMVRVLGVVTGEQQYRSKQGGVQTAPAISARFILPLVK